MDIKNNFISNQPAVKHFDHLSNILAQYKNSNILFDEQHIIVNKTLAREIGLNEALILQQINYWIEINKKSGNNFYDGRYWTYNSIRVWQEKDFDYMSFDTVKRNFANTNLIDVVGCASK